MSFLYHIFQVLYVLCFTRPRYQVSVYRAIGPPVRTEAVLMCTPANPSQVCSILNVFDGVLITWMR